MMKNQNHPERGDSSGEPSPPVKRRRQLLSLLIGLLVMSGGIIGAAYIGKNAPDARRRPPVKITPLVQIETVQPASHQVTVRAMGTVIPAREMTLRSQVAGRIVSVHPEFSDGGLLPKGEQVLAIDPADYRLAVTRKQSAVIAAEYAMKLELGHQAVALREWELLNEGRAAAAEDVELALRKPHLAKVSADLEAVRADLQQAELDLERTRIRVPFNAMVRAKHVEIGSQVSTQDALAELVGTDACHIRVSIPGDRLQWFDIPRHTRRTGVAVRVIYRSGLERTGTVIKLLGDLETEGRMARILVSVDDPFGLDKQGPAPPPLLIGEYVRVEIAGKRLDGVFRIPRTALRDNAKVWVAGARDQLDIRPVETIWRDSRSVLLKSGLAPGDRVIVSDLPAPVAGMPLRIASPAGQTPTGKGQPGPAGKD